MDKSEIESNKNRNMKQRVASNQVGFELADSVSFSCMILQSFEPFSSTFMISKPQR